jgi:hypothetical protein
VFTDEALAAVNDRRRDATSLETCAKDLTAFSFRKRLYTISDLSLSPTMSINFVLTGRDSRTLEISIVAM